MIDTALWNQRIATLEFLTVSFAYPTQQLANAVASGEWLSAARQCASLLGADLGTGTGASDAGEAAGSSADPDVERRLAACSVDTLKAESTRLFIGAPFPKVMPYEGVNRSGDPFKAMLYVNPGAIKVQQFMIDCGLHLAEGNDPMDHVATELELMLRLALAAVGEGDAAQLADAGKLPGGSPSAAYDAFFGDHASQWMPAFADDVIAATELDFFRIAARLLKAFFIA